MSNEKKQNDENRTFSERVTLRLSKENYAALEELGVFRDRTFTTIMNDLVSAYVKTGSVTTIAQTNFAEMVDDAMDTKMAQMQKDLQAAMNAIYRIECFNMRLLSQNPDNRSYIPYAKKKSWTDYTSMLMGEKFPRDLGSDFDESDENAEVEENDGSKEITEMAEVPKPRKVARTVMTRFSRNDSNEENGENRKSAEMPSGDEMSDQEEFAKHGFDENRQMSQMPNPDEFAGMGFDHDDANGGMGESDEDADLRKSGNSPSEENLESEEKFESAESDERLKNENADDGENVAKGETAEDSEIGQTDENTETEESAESAENGKPEETANESESGNGEPAEKREWHDGDFCEETGKTINLHAYDTGLPDSEYHATKEDEEFIRNNPDAAKFADNQFMTREQVKNLRMDLVRAAMSVCGKNFLTPEQEAKMKELGIKHGPLEPWDDVIAEINEAEESDESEE